MVHNALQLNKMEDILFIYLNFHPINSKILNNSKQQVKTSKNKDSITLFRHLKYTKTKEIEFETKGRCISVQLLSLDIFGPYG